MALGARASKGGYQAPRSPGNSARGRRPASTSPWRGSAAPPPRTLTTPDGPPPPNQPDPGGGGDHPGASRAPERGERPRRSGDPQPDLRRRHRGGVVAADLGGRGGPGRPVTRRRHRGAGAGG